MTGMGGQVLVEDVDVVVGVFVHAGAEGGEDGDDEDRHGPEDRAAVPGEAGQDVPPERLTGAVPVDMGGAGDVDALKLVSRFDDGFSHGASLPQAESWGR